MQSLKIIFFKYVFMLLAKERFDGNFLKVECSAPVRNASSGFPVPARQGLWYVQLYMISKMGKDTMLEASETGVMVCSIIHDFKDGQRYNVGSKRDRGYGMFNYT